MVSFGFAELLPVRKPRRGELSWKRIKVREKSIGGRGREGTAGFLRREETETCAYLILEVS